MFKLTGFALPSYFSHHFFHSCLLFLSIYSNTSSAEIRIQLEEPTWSFLLKNELLSPTETKIPASESEFARTLQPLLEADNHSAVIDAFNKRDIENDSAALRQLRGQVLLTLKKYSDAEAALKSALELMPNLAGAHRNLSIVYLMQERYSLARTHLQRTIELGHADAQVYGQLGFINLQTKHAASAISGYQYALFLEPDNTNWQQGLLYALTDTGSFNQAQALLEEMLKKKPEKQGLWLKRSQIALQQERYTEAIASLEAALSLGNKDTVNLATTIQLHIQSGSPARAVELLANNITSFNNPENIDTLDQIAAWFTQQQDWRQFSRINTAFKNIENEVPQKLKARFQVYNAQMAIAEKRPKDARKLLESAIKVNPNHGDALITLAELNRNQRREEQALMHYIRAQALPLYKERALLGRAQLEIDRQNYSEALRLLRNVLQENPNRSELHANIRSLENLIRNKS